MADFDSEAYFLEMAQALANQAEALAKPDAPRSMRRGRIELLKYNVSVLAEWNNKRLAEAERDAS